MLLEIRATVHQDDFMYGCMLPNVDHNPFLRQLTSFHPVLVPSFCNALPSTMLWWLSAKGRYGTGEGPRLWAYLSSHERVSSSHHTSPSPRSTSGP